MTGQVLEGYLISYYVHVVVTAMYLASVLGHSVKCVFGVKYV